MARHHQHRHGKAESTRRYPSTERYSEIQKAIVKALQEHYEPPEEMSDHLQTLLRRLNNNDEDK
jgi:hypothetical protein